MSGTIQTEAERFASLAALRTAHSQLLKTYARTGETSEFKDAAITLITKGRATGVILETEEERLDAQQILDHWATMLYRLGTEPPDATLAPFDRSALPDLSDKPCPYKGMDPFGEDDADNFFGCERLVEKLIRRFSEHRILFLAGHSGSGKSSLVLAGLVPALKKGALPESSSWRYLPTLVPGSDPLESLHRLAHSLGIPGGQIGNSGADAFRKDVTCLRQVLASSADRFPVLVVDQFEEIFSLCNDQEAREAFVANLVSVMEAPQPEAAIIFTLRTEFVPAVEQLGPLRRFFKTCLETFTPLNEAELREVITEPARKVGLEFQAGVVDALVHDVMGEAAPLPLLQFSLLKLWEGRDRNRVKLDSYLRLGAPRVALAAAAEKFYNEQGHLDRKIVQGVLLRMVGLSENSVATSRPVGRAALHRMEYEPAQIDSVLQQMRENHLLRIAKGRTGSDDQIEVAHETLVQKWTRLADWIERQRGALTVRRRLDEYTVEWVRLGRSGAGLLDATQLEEADEWLRSQRSRELGYNDALPALVKASRDALDARHRHDLEQAQALADAERQRAEEQRLKAQAEHCLAEKKATAARRLRNGVIAISVLFLIALTAGILAMLAEKEARRQRLRAVAQTLAARAPSLPNDSGALLGRQAYLFYRRSAGRSPDRYLAHQVDHALRTVLSAPYFTHVLSGAPGGVFSVAVSPDGKEIAAGGRDGILRLWNVEHPSQEPVQIPVFETARGAGTIWSVAFHPTRPLVATVVADPSSAEGTVALWTTESGTVRPEPLPAELVTKVTSVLFSPDGKFMATGAPDGNVQLWEVGTGNSVVTLSRPQPSATTPLHKSYAGRTALTFSPGGQKVAAAGRDGILFVWDLNQPGSSPITLPWRRGGITALTFCSDDQTLAAGGQDGLIFLWNLAQLEWPQAILSGHKRAVSSLSFNIHAGLLASSSWDGSVYVRRLGQQTDVPDILRSHGGGVTSTAFETNGGLLVSGSIDGTVGVYEIRGRNVSPGPALPQVLREHSERVTAVAISPDGQLQAAGTVEGSVRLVNLQQPETTSAVLKGTQAAVRSVAFSADKQRVAAGNADGSVVVWDLSAPDREAQIFPGEDGVFSVCFNSRGTQVAAGTFGGSVRIFEIANPTAAPLVFFGDRLRGVVSVAFNDNDARILAGGWDGVVRVWDLRAPAAGPQVLIGQSRANTSPSLKDDAITSVAYSQDGLTMVANFIGGSARLINLRNPTADPFVVPGRQGGITAVALSPDGHTAAVGRGDKSVQVWDLRKPDEMRLVLRGHKSFTIALAFGADDRTLTSSSTTETFWSWIGATETLADEVCKRAWQGSVSQDEWLTMVGEGVPYERTCPER